MRLSQPNRGRHNSSKLRKGDSIATPTTILTSLYVSTNLLFTPSIPSIESAELAHQYAPLAQTWRQQAEALAEALNEQREVNRLLHEEIDRLKAEVTATEWRTFTATAYTADCAEGCTGITATGLDVRNRTHVEGKRVIATDPSVIPLGSTVEIRFSDGTVERAVAVDTGGAIDGNIIDYLVSDYQTAVNFGRQKVEVRIISEGER